MKLYVGTYTSLGGPGVCVCEMTDDGLRLTATADTFLEDPSYVILTRDKKTLLATTGTSSDGEPGDSLATFDVTGDTPRLTSIHSTGGGVSACHIALSPDERFAYVACYGTGTIAVFPFENGRLGPRIQLVRHEGHSVNPKRQEGPHAHYVAFHPEDDARLYCVDLGLDAVMIHRQDRQTGLLTYETRAEVPAGLGPRHLAFRNDMMYVADELKGAVSVFRALGEAWEYVETLSTLPEGGGEEGAVAAIRVDDDRVFVSNRDNDSIAVFEIIKGGRLRLERVFSTFGQYPRDFFVLPGREILVANQNSGDVRLLGMEPVEIPAEEDEDQPRGALSGLWKLFDGPQTRQWLKPIIGETPDTSMPGGVYQIGDELPIKGAVCVCPVME